MYFLLLMPTCAVQLLPLFTMEVLGSLHGLPGLFTAAVFSGTLR